MSFGVFGSIVTPKIIRCYQNALLQKSTVNIPIAHKLSRAKIPLHVKTGHISLGTKKKSHFWYVFVL